MILISNLFLKNNEANYGGSLYFSSISLNTFSGDYLFTNNVALVDGGAMYFEANSTTTIQC